MCVYREKEKKGVYLMLNKPQLIRLYPRITNKRTIMANQRLELASKVIALDPGDHERAEAGSCGDAVIRVDEVVGVVDVLPGFG